MSKASSSSGGSRKGENVRVAVRCRPLNGAEKERSEASIVVINAAAGSVTVQQVARGEGGGGEDAEAAAGGAEDGGGGGGGRRPLCFTFDFAYDSHSSQASIFEQTAQPIVDSVLQGYNGTIFAYGQTGTGKTHTMEGVMDDPELRGLMPNTFHYVFACVSRAPASVRFLLRASFLEIYQDDVFDLLAVDGRKKVDIKEHKDKGVFVRDLQETTVQSVAELLKVLKSGSQHRKVGATKMNEGSSRSHSVLTITVETSEEAAAQEGAKQPAPLYRVGKLHLVDLAGSERQKQTNAQGERLEEAKAINRSLTVLGNVIKALVEQQRHIPYRDSKLTRLLQDSLGGNTKTVMIAAIGPAASNCMETLSTLRYADRAKQITNRPVVNEDPKDTMLKAFQDEIAQLKRMLEEGGAGAEGGDGEEEGEAGGDSAEGGEEDGGVVVLDGGEVIARAGDRLIRTKVVDRVVLVGVSEEEVARLQAEAEAKRLLLEEAHSLEKEEIASRQRAMEEQQRSAAQRLTDRQTQLAEQKARRMELRRALQKVEGQLVAGQTAVSEARAAEEAIVQHKEALQRQSEDKRRLEEELRSREEGQLSLADKAEELEKELQAKLRQWEKLQSKSALLQAERDASRARQQKEREELLTACRELQQSIQLKRTIQRTFMPKHLATALHDACHRDPNTGQWSLAAADAQDGGELMGDGSAPSSLHPPSRPMSVRGAASRASIYSTAHGLPPRARGRQLQPPLPALPPVSDFALQRRAELRRLEEEEQPSSEEDDDGSTLDSFAAKLRWKVDNIAPLTLDMPDSAALKALASGKSAPSSSSGAKKKDAAAGGGRSALASIARGGAGGGNAKAASKGGKAADGAKTDKAKKAKAATEEKAEEEDAEGGEEEKPDAGEEEEDAPAASSSKASKPKAAKGAGSAKKRKKKRSGGDDDDEESESDEDLPSEVDEDEEEAMKEIDPSLIIHSKRRRTTVNYKVDEGDDDDDEDEDD